MVQSACNEISFFMLFRCTFPWKLYLLYSLHLSPKLLHCCHDTFSLWILSKEKCDTAPNLMASSFNLSLLTFEMKGAYSTCSERHEAVMWHVWMSLLSVCSGWNRRDAVKNVGVPAQSDPVPTETSEELGGQWAAATEKRLGHPTNQCARKLPRTLSSHARQGEWQLLSSRHHPKLWFTTFITCLPWKDTSGWREEKIVWLKEMFIWNTDIKKAMITFTIYTL